MSFPSLADYSPDELVLMADTHDDMAFAEMLRGTPKARFEGNFCEFLSGMPNPFGNMMFGLDVPRPASTVPEITERVKALGVPAFWWVGPCTKPADLGAMLIANGWVDTGAAPAMVVDLSLLPDTPGPEGFELREVKTTEDLAVWHETVAAGFKLPMEIATMMAPREYTKFKLYTGYLNGQPVGTTAMFLFEGVAGIYCVATLPDFRGRGVGAAVTAQPLLWARSQGYKVGTLQASKMGHPIYKRLGFYEVGAIRHFEYGQ